MQMQDRWAHESLNRAIESLCGSLPEAAEYIEKHIVMDDQKMIFAYTCDNRISLEQLFQTIPPR
jgi:hypothetical protein